MLFDLLVLSHLLRPWRNIKKTDIFVNPSDTDSLDKIVLEAMSCGIPVLASNICFNSILGEWVDTCMMPKHNPEVLAKRLNAYFQMSENVRHELGQTLRDIVVQEHSLDNLARRLVEDILLG